ncbi:MAG: copper-binding protein [Pseudomonadota bacterium]
MKTVAMIAVAAALAAPALAQQGGPASHSAHGGGAMAQAATLAEGEIRKVDREAKKLTIKHGPIANLDMPAMTMVFQVKDPALLDKVKPGDRVKFQAERLGGALTVTSLEPAQ